MYLVERSDGVRMKLNDKIQLDAFLASGWHEVEEKAATPVRETKPEAAKAANRYVGRGRKK